MVSRSNFLRLLYCAAALASAVSGNFTTSLLAVTGGSPLHSCGDLTKSGSYYLANNVSSTGTCFFIDASLIRLNLNGYTITYATQGNSKPTPGIVLADPWFADLARSGTRSQHNSFEVYGGSIIEGQSGAAKSAAIWVGQSNGINPAPSVHDLTLKTYSTDAATIYSMYGANGWKIYNNKLSALARTTTDRQEFTGEAVMLTGTVSGGSADQIHNNMILAAPQGGIRTMHQNARIYSNDITFNSTASNDFCVDAPASGQQIYSNKCHPTSGRGFHTSANNVAIHDNTVIVKELRQNAEYGGCELDGTYGVQVEYDSQVNPDPSGIVVQNNNIQAIAGDCDAAGLRITGFQPNGSVTFNNNKVTTSNKGGSGVDRAIYFSATDEGSNTIKFITNTFQAQHAYVGSDWLGARVVIQAGQHWDGNPKYIIDDQDGFLAQAVSFSQSITIDDFAGAKVNCGSYAKSVDRIGNSTTNCGY